MDSGGEVGKPEGLEEYAKGGISAGGRNRLLGLSRNQAN